MAGFPPDRARAGHPPDVTFHRPLLFIPELQRVFHEGNKPGCFHHLPAPRGSLQQRTLPTGILPLSCMESRGGLMLCECDREQMRCAVTAPLHHCWIANVRSQTAYVQTRVGERSLGCVVWVCVCHLSVVLTEVYMFDYTNSMLEYQSIRFADE